MEEPGTENIEPPLTTVEQVKTKIRNLQADIAQRKDRIQAFKSIQPERERSMTDVLNEVLGEETTTKMRPLKGPSTPMTAVKGEKINIYPKEIGFEKGCQTQETGPATQETDKRSSGKTAQEGGVEAAKKEDPLGGVRRTQTEQVLPSPEHKTAEGGEKEETGPSWPDAGQGTVLPERELTEEDKERILADSAFHDFFDASSKLVERCLSQKQDPLRDYTGEYIPATEDASGTEELIEEHVFSDLNYTQGRPVTDVRRCPKFPELLLASYGQMESPSLQDPSGLALVWNLGLHSRPEHVFTSNSPVLTAICDKYNPALYIGGTYSGAILLWDARVKRTPVQRTPLTSKGHAYPVYAVEQVGTQNATNLITGSSDGKLCIWSLSMLNTPQEYLELKKSNREVVITSMTFPEGETNMLYVGAEDGTVCQVHVHGTKSAPITHSLEGHSGPVTAVDFHPQPATSGSPIYSSLILSSSIDWSVKLWNVKNRSQFPVLHFDGMYEDYVTDVKWHPIAPHVFSSADSEGQVTLWNLNNDPEGPTVTTEKKNCALNRLDWTSDGRHIAAGDVEGNVYLYSADKDYAHPKQDDFAKFEQRVSNLEPIVHENKDLVFGGRSKLVLS